MIKIINNQYLKFNQSIIKSQELHGQNKYLNLISKKPKYYPQKPVIFIRNLIILVLSNKIVNRFL